MLLNCKTSLKEFLGRFPLHLASTHLCVCVCVCRICSNTLICTSHTEKIMLRIHFPIPQRRYNSSTNTIELLECSPYPIPSGPPRVGEEISKSHRQWTGFQFNFILWQFNPPPPPVQIPGLLKAGGVPLGRFNSGGIMGRIINKLHTKNCKIPAH